MFDFKNIPPITKNLIIINVIMFIAKIASPGGLNLTDELGLHYYAVSSFAPYQLLTHMFMHGSLMHIFFNMFALFMFGRVLEQRLGPKRFLIFYLGTGIGAVFLHFFAVSIEQQAFTSAIKVLEMNPDINLYKELIINHFSRSNYPGSPQIVNWAFGLNESAMGLSGVNQETFILESLDYIMDTKYNVVVGASGAVFGLLAGFGLLYPNQQLYLMFIPVPIKAKYFVLLYAGFELYNGMQNDPSDNIAHFAHLGGALFGFLMIRNWRKKYIL